jgi:hypothetical protein
MPITLNLCNNAIPTNAHIIKKIIKKKKKSHNSLSVLVAAQTPSKQHLKFKFSISEASKKRISVQTQSSFNHRC